MNAMSVVERWDSALRAGDWERAKGLLTDDATYHAPEAAPEFRIDCETPQEIIGFMSAWKGKVPDVEVVAWKELGNQVLARLRQPAWGSEAGWYQVRTVRDDRVARLVDYGSEESALAAIEAPAGPRNAS